ncbi:MAG: hydrogenase iron-sulfur subunit [Bacteroidales bacterium]
MENKTVNQQHKPKILVFSTDKISDPGIDLAGQQHIHYSTCTCCISVPCSSGIKPRWILRALQKGFDGVFIAADGTDCPYTPNCGEITGNIMRNTQAIMKDKNINPNRLKMAAVCSVCAEPFARHMDNFSKTLAGLGDIKTEKYQKDDKK